MRIWGILFILFGLSTQAYVHTAPFGQFGNQTWQELDEEFGTAAKRIGNYEKTGMLPEGGLAELKQLKEKQKWRGRQRARLRHNLDQKSEWALALGGILFSLSLILGILKKRKMQKLYRPSGDGSDIPDAIPREEYVDEWEFARKSEGGYLSREEAVHWINLDPLSKCDYCGENLRSTYMGDREALEFVTYYKKVPVDAKDLRIVMGSRWFVKMATELKCTGCNRVLKR